MKTTTFKIKTINEVALVQVKKKNKTKQKTNTDRGPLREFPGRETEPPELPRAIGVRAIFCQWAR